MAPRAVIDFSAREGHFLDHLAPVWTELPPDWRGQFHVGEGLTAHAVAAGIDPGRIIEGWPRRFGHAPVVMASWSDLRVCSRMRRPLVLFEHGAGQSYSSRHRSYVGGAGRERVSLAVVPNVMAAERHRAFYPASQVAVVGCPKLGRLQRLPRVAGPPTAAVSFHWRCTVSPESGSALDDFAAELEATRRALEGVGVTLIGHAHPRIMAEAAGYYRAAGIEVVHSFDEVVARADLYAVDNSSTLFEFAALGRPVVLLNARAYRRDIEHGLRFWTEADVGVHAEPGGLADAILEALDDDLAVAASREAVVERVYPCTDGTSAHRAAAALVSHASGSCIICGAAHRSCGQPTEVIPIDDRIRERGPMSGTLKRYENPGRPGTFLKLNDTDARRMGLFGKGQPDRRKAAPRPDVTNEGGDGLASSVEVAPPGKTLADTLPKGALRPGGPTHRARAAAEAAAKADAAPGQQDDDDDDAEVKDKKVRPPAGRRRRRVEPGAK